MYIWDTVLCHSTIRGFTILGILVRGAGIILVFIGVLALPGAGVLDLDTGEDTIMGFGVGSGMVYGYPPSCTTNMFTIASIVPIIFTDIEDPLAAR